VAPIVVLAELEIHHSRPIAPTRRIALGRRELPVDPAPGFGGVLLSAIVAQFAPELDAELYDDLLLLMRQLERGQRIPQPRLRHRFQRDLIGLAKCRHRLIGVDEALRLELDRHGPPAPMVLGAVYAAGQVAPPMRWAVMEAMRRGLRWRGTLDRSFIAVITGRQPIDWTASSIDDPVGWAKRTLGIHNGEVIRRELVQRKFRELLRHAHPDSGGDEDGAARRITELAEARRILIG
jgi:hypothetical protein